MNISFYFCDRNDYVAVELNGNLIMYNDYGVENLLKLAKVLNWTISQQTLTGTQMEQKFG